ncbi:MAG: hypothetical protein ABW195_12600 [Ilumatobacteraceae bacterium]
MGHLAFGHGERFCPGAAPARAEGRIALEVLLARLADIRPADGVDLAGLEYEARYVLHGLRRGTTYCGDGQRQTPSVPPSRSAAGVGVGGHP